MYISPTLIQKCPICHFKLVKTGAKTLINKESRFDWESDSTFEILNLKQVICEQMFCTKCFFSIITPQFDTSILYSENGPLLRKKHFESYFPNSKYDQKKTIISFPRVFNRISNELTRFTKISKFLGKHLSHKSLPSNISEIKILDWGGSDGYVGHFYAHMLQMATHIKSKNVIFDYSDCKTEEAKNITMENLRKNGPYDVVVISHVLEHTHTPSETLKDALLFLKKGGLLIVEVPDQRITTLKNILKRQCLLSFHVTHFTRRALHKLLKKESLGSIHTSYFTRSSYRGTGLSTVIACAINENTHNNEKPPTFLWDILGLFKIIVNKIVYRL